MFERIAIVKLNQLMAQADFVKIFSITNDCTTLSFHNKTCKILKSGRVIWVAEPQCSQEIL